MSFLAADLAFGSGTISLRSSGSIGPVGGSSRFRIRAGLPPMTTLSGQSPLTTEPAAIVQSISRSRVGVRKAQPSDSGPAKEEKKGLAVSDLARPDDPDSAADPHVVPELDGVRPLVPGDALVDVDAVGGAVDLDV